VGALRVTLSFMQVECGVEMHRVPLPCSHLSRTGSLARRNTCPPQGSYVQEPSLTKKSRYLSLPTDRQHKEREYFIGPIAPGRKRDPACGKRLLEPAQPASFLPFDAPWEFVARNLASVSPVMLISSACTGQKAHHGWLRRAFRVNRVAS
jgi:hypothetical protein